MTTALVCIGTHALLAFTGVVAHTSDRKTGMAVMSAIGFVFDAVCFALVLRSTP